MLPLLACCGLLPPAPTLAWHTRRALGVLFLLAGASFLPPAPAAQNPDLALPLSAQPVHVSNLLDVEQGLPWVESATQAVNIWVRNSFSTGGPATDRFTLNKVILNVYARADLLTVRIYNDSNGSLGAQVGGDLVRQVGESRGVRGHWGHVTFNAPDGITLHGGTTYWLAVIHAHDTDDLGRAVYEAAIRHTESASESGTDGWSIGNTHGFWHNSGAHWVTRPAAAVDADSIDVRHNDTSLEVSWDAPEGATHYDVTYTGSNGATGRAAWNRASTSLTIGCDVREGYENQHCVSGATDYRVGVRARNAGGPSPWTNAAWASFEPPAAPSSLDVTHNGSSLSVSWDAVAEATSHHVTYTDADAIDWQLAEAAHTGTSLTISGVDSAKTYLVGVRAKNAAGASDWMNSEWTPPPSTLTAPDPVTSIVNRPGREVDNIGGKAVQGVGPCPLVAPPCPSALVRKRKSNRSPCPVPAAWVTAWCSAPKLFCPAGKESLTW